MMRGFCPRGFCPEGAYVLMELCMEGVLSEGVLSEGVLSEGVLSGGGFVLPSCMLPCPQSVAMCYQLQEALEQTNNSRS